MSLLQHKINYNRDQIKTLLLCNNHKNIFVPPEIYFYIIDFLDYTMNLDNMTNNINRLMLDTTTEILHDTLWPDIIKLNADPHKELALDRWIYGEIYRTVEDDHKYNKKQFTRLNWESSFTLEISWLIFHG